MQRPTLQGVRIRSTRDALQVFNAVACNRLPLITRRLDAEERRVIMPGNVYVWEERGANTEPTGLGMERWTDGMGWGPSRVRDVSDTSSCALSAHKTTWLDTDTHPLDFKEFLFYHQKESDMADDFLNPIPESERLIKQTYSVHVSLPADRQRGIVRKWHLTAYFSQARLDQLATVDNIRGIGDVPVPEGWFRSARTAKTRRNTHTQSSESDTPKQPSPTSYSDPHSPLVSSSRHHPSSGYAHSPASSSGHSSKTSSISSLSSAYNPRSPSLVPLDVLQNSHSVPRDPTDVQTLRRFASGHGHS
ncbi:hypothetical protein CC1G_05266 [Coprinopsis cinerea okayama7|uniref:cAMP-independent regulatory protein pac2 n=1 Tax=Coprinopsis cinerea (strain Okayama-7 / 130 / ATCC MYA-4618 / FGSC 9003) TaxID=240176 RepID=A8PCE9_COPC7|nr:hypothetical protein CC1G_05266 [Coprinopsis cinerea okayama7\|eukprot:XP_001840380.2 hypothetical protein CC1G_05266 [Coprinopsis cinerea okayama7\